MDKTKITWTERTWNTVSGCTKLGKECLNCYAERETNIRKDNPTYSKYKEGFDKVVEHKETLNEPYQWKEPTVVFVNSMSDLFHNDVSLDFIKAVFKAMNETPQHTYQVLTKRSKNLLKYSSELNWTDNIWAGVSVGINATKHRIDDLRQCGAKHKFISVEPLLEQIDDLDLNGIDWVIVGGESGNNDVRPLQYEWVKKIKEICEHQKVPFFFKQWGRTENNPDKDDPTLDKNHPYHTKGGCLLDGKIYWENPSNPTSIVKTIKLFDVDHYVIDEYEGLKTIWKLQTYLPEMEADLFQQLKADINANGLNDPILYIPLEDGDKLVIEGHTRLKVAIDLKLKDIPTKEIKNDFENIDDVKLWMMKHQFQRRNLSPVERLNLAFLSKSIIEKKAKENLSKAGKGIDVDEKFDTNEAIGKIVGVSRTTVVRYNTVLEKASEKVKTEMRKGDISISYASKTIEKLKSKPKKIKVFGNVEEQTKKIDIEAEAINGFSVQQNSNDEPSDNDQPIDSNVKPVVTIQPTDLNEEPLVKIKTLLDGELSEYFDNNNGRLRGFIEFDGEIRIISSSSDIYEIINKIEFKNNSEKIDTSDAQEVQKNHKTHKNNETMKIFELNGRAVIKMTTDHFVTSKKVTCMIAQELYYTPESEIDKQLLNEKIEDATFQYGEYIDELYNEFNKEDLKKAEKIGKKFFPKLYQ